MVCEFMDVFPNDLPRLPPDRDVEFRIDLKLGTAPVSRRAYRMPPKELAELKNPTTRVVRQGFHSTQFITLGMPCYLREEEGPNLKVMC